MSSPKEFHIDAIYPEPLSRLRRGHGMTPLEASNSASYRRAVKKQRNRSAGRFRTQPVTFQEIKEVDEDNIVEPESENLRGSVGTVASSAAFKSDSDLKASFQLFYQSIKCGNDEDPVSSTPTAVLDSLDTLSPLLSSKEGSHFVYPPLQDTSNSEDIDNKDKYNANDCPSSSINSSLPQSSPITISMKTRTRQSF